MIGWILRHLQVFFYTLGQLWRSPGPTLLTVGVIAITLALPAGLYVLLENVSTLSAEWEGGARISLYLKPGTGEDRARALAEELRRLPDVAGVDHITAAAALEEFKRLSGFGDALAALDANPLPPVLLIEPATATAGTDSLQRLVAELGRRPGVDLAQLDAGWVQRLHALLRLAQRGVLIVGALLAVAVLLIVGNTVRLAVLNRRDEIQIISLVGGTAAFIRRPFLYAGVLQGLLGAAGAWGLVQLALALLSGPVERLGALYATHIGLQGLVPAEAALMLLGGGAIGWLASWLAVGRHLDELQPR